MELLHPPQIPNIIITRPPRMERQDWVWRIRDFSKLINSLRADISGNTLSTDFDAGASLDLMSSWRLTFTLSNRCLPDRHTKWFARVQRIAGSPNATYFSATVSVKSLAAPNVDLYRVEMHRTQPSKMFGRLGQMMDASEEDVLKIHVRFDMWPNTNPLAAEEVMNKIYLLKSGEDSDALIKVLQNGRVTEIKVHRRILTAASPVFAQMAEDVPPTEIWTLDIPDLSLASVHVLLQYIYTGSLESWKPVAEELVLAAGRYGMEALLGFLDRNLHTLAKVGNAKGLRRLARREGLEIAAKKITHYIIANLNEIDLL